LLGTLEMDGAADFEGELDSEGAGDIDGIPMYDGAKEGASEKYLGGPVHLTLSNAPRSKTLSQSFR